MKSIAFLLFLLEFSYFKALLKISVSKSSLMSQFYLHNSKSELNQLNKLNNLNNNDNKILFDVLLKYNELFNSTIVPRSFTVPTNDQWPKHLQGFYLGKALECYRKINKDIYIIDIHTNIRTNFTLQHATRDLKFEVFLIALKLHKCEINNNSIISRDWVVPSKAPWPIECWGLKLGSKVSAVRRGALYNNPTQIDKLNEIGFVWNASTKAINKLCYAAKYYQNNNGHLCVPKNFVIPCDDSYPEEFWGFKIGSKLNNIRYRGDFNQYQTILQEIGIEMDKVGIDTRHWEYVYSALKVYKNLYGHLNVPKNWFVPSEDPWPKNTWDLKLGFKF
jgi:hypothetical protein